MDSSLDRVTQTGSGDSNLPTLESGDKSRLYRVEYDDTAGDGTFVARKAAMVPIRDTKERSDLAYILKIVSRHTPDFAYFLVEKIGGRMVRPYEVGDPVEVIDGSYKGSRFFLAERTESGVNWWLSRSPGEPAFLGLHCDYFRPIDEKD